MFTYDEHSGAGNTGWPQLNDRDKLEEQNREYVNYMQEAEKQSELLLDQGMELLAEPSRGDAQQSLASSNVWPLLVYNALSTRCPRHSGRSCHGNEGRGDP